MVGLRSSRDSGLRRGRRVEGEGRRVEGEGRRVEGERRGEEGEGWRGGGVEGRER